MIKNIWHFYDSPSNSQALEFSSYSHRMTGGDQVFQCKHPSWTVSHLRLCQIHWAESACNHTMMQRLTKVHQSAEGKKKKIALFKCIQSYSKYLSSKKFNCKPSPILSMIRKIWDSCGRTSYRYAMSVSTSPEQKRITLGLIICVKQHNEKELSKNYFVKWSTF